MPLLSRVAGAVAAVLALSACSTGPSATTDGATSSATGSDSASTASDAFPVTVTHALGETVIEAEPTRVATIGWTDHETLVSLGVVPVGAVEITWGGNAEGSTDWFDEAVAELGGEQPTRYDDSAGAPIEEIVALEPDLILATNSGLTQEEYDTLTKVAPVVAYPEAPWSTSWQDSLELVGEAVGRSDRAAEVEAETNALLEDAGAEYPEIAGTQRGVAVVRGGRLLQVRRLHRHRRPPAVPRRRRLRDPRRSSPSSATAPPASSRSTSPRSGPPSSTRT